MRRLSSLLARPVSLFLWTKTWKKKREQYPAILTEQTWLTKDLLNGRENVFFRDQSGKPRSLVRFLVGEEPGNVPWSQRFFLKFFYVFARANGEAAMRERKTFFSHSSPLCDSLSPLRCSLSLSRRKISRKIFGTRVLGTRLSGKFPADKTGPFSLGSQSELRIRFTLLSRGTSHLVYKLYVLQPSRIKFDL